LSRVHVRGSAASGRIAECRCRWLVRQGHRATRDRASAFTLCDVQRERSGSGRFA
jgi:hypothetical protein